MFNCSKKENDKKDRTDEDKKQEDQNGDSLRVKTLMRKKIGNETKIKRGAMILEKLSQAAGWQVNAEELLYKVTKSSAIRTCEWACFVWLSDQIYEQCAQEVEENDNQNVWIGLKEYYVNVIAKEVKWFKEWAMRKETESEAREWYRQKKKIWEEGENGASLIEFKQTDEEKFVEPIKVVQNKSGRRKDGKGDNQLGEDMLIDKDEQVDVEMGSKDKNKEEKKEIFQEIRMKRKKRADELKQLMMQKEGKSNEVRSNRLWTKEPEDNQKNILGQAKTIKEIAEKWQQIQDENINLEKEIKDWLNQQFEAGKEEIRLVKIIVALWTKTEELKQIIKSMEERKVVEDKIELKVANNKNLKGKRDKYQIQINNAVNRSRKEGFIPEDQWKRLTPAQRVLEKFRFRDFKQNPPRAGEFDTKDQDKFLIARKEWRKRRVDELIKEIKEGNKNALKHADNFIFYEERTVNGFYVARKFNKEIWEKHQDDKEVKQKLEWIKNEVFDAAKKGKVFNVVFEKGVKYFVRGESASFYKLIGKKRKRGAGEKAQEANASKQGRNFQ